MPVESLIAPRGGLRYDLPADLISKLEMSDARNVFFQDGLIKKRYGYGTKGSNLPLDGVVVGITQFQDYSGGSWLLAGTENQLYKYLSNGSWDTVSDAGGYFGYSTFGSGAFGANAGDMFSASDSNDLSFAVVRKTTETDPWLIISNGVDHIKKWTGTGAASNLISDYPSGVTSLLAKYVLEFKTYLILLRPVENGNVYPHRIRWSDTADPEDFVNGNASYLDLPPKPTFGDPDEIKGGVQLGADLIGIFKGSSIWTGYATGDTDIFEMSRRANEGCVSGKTVAVVEDIVLYMGHEDVFAFDGDTVESVGGPIRRELFKTTNPGQKSRSYCKVFREMKEYWLFVPTASNTYPDVAWCLKYDTGKWNRHAFADYLTMRGDYTSSSRLTIGDLTGTIGQQTWRIGSRNIQSSTPTTLFGDSDGYIYEYDELTNNDNDTAIDAWFTTKDFNPTKLKTRFRINRIDTYYTGAGLDLSYSTNKGKTWISIATLDDSDNLETPRQAFDKIDTPICRLRWRNNTLGEHFEFNRASIYWEPSGERL